MGKDIGWMESSAPPGSDGVCVIMGHRNTQFRILKDVEKNDTVVITDATGSTYSEKGKLDDDTIYRIFNGEIGQKPKPNRTPVVKINKTIYERYFKTGQPAKEVEEVVEKALELYFDSQQ